MDILTNAEVSGFDTSPLEKILAIIVVTAVKISSPVLEAIPSTIHGIGGIYCLLFYLKTRDHHTSIEMNNSFRVIKTSSCGVLHDVHMFVHWFRGFMENCVAVGVRQA